MIATVRTVFAVLVLVLTCSPSLADQQSIQQTLDQLKAALNEHEFALLEPVLAEDFSFAGHQGTLAKGIMRQIVNQYPRTIMSISIRDVVHQNGRIRATVAIDLGNEIEIKHITLSRDFRILEAPIVEIQMASHSPGESDAKEPASVALPARMDVVFELAGRLIIVTAEIEGVRGNFLVDSGATGFLLNGPRLAGLHARATPTVRTMHGANGPMENTNEVIATNFKWQDIELATIKAVVSDLSHLEQNIGTELIGVIGSNFLRQFTILFDYEQRRLTLFSVDPKGQWDSPPDRTVDLEIIGHIPVLTARVGQYHLLLGIDSAAEGAMLFRKWEDRLRDQYETTGRETLNGADLHSRETETIALSSFSVNGAAYKGHKFVLADLQFDHDLIIDGLLGYEFLSSQRTAINFRAKKLYLWPEEG